MKTWSEFYPDALVELPGVPYPLLDKALRDAAIEFCERSMAWRLDLDPIDGAEDVGEYAIVLPDNTDLIEIKAVKYDGEGLTLRGPGYLRDTYGADWQDESGTPVDYTQADTENIILVPMPSDDLTDGIEINAAVKPGVEATGVEDWIFTQYRRKLAAGAMSTLMLMADKPWTNPDRAVIHAATFESAVMRATEKANAGFGLGRPRSKGNFV